MKLGFNKKTMLLAWDILVLVLMIKSLGMFFGYWLPTKPLETYEIRSMVLASMGGVAYLLAHQLFDKEETIASS